VIWPLWRPEKSLFRTLLSDAGPYSLLLLLTLTPLCPEPKAVPELVGNF